MSREKLTRRTAPILVTGMIVLTSFSIGPFLEPIIRKLSGSELWYNSNWSLDRSDSHNFTSSSEPFCGLSLLSMDCEFTKVASGCNEVSVRKKERCRGQPSVYGVILTVLCQTFAKHLHHLLQPLGIFVRRRYHRNRLFVMLASLFHDPFPVDSVFWRRYSWVNEMITFDFASYSLDPPS